MGNYYQGPNKEQAIAKLRALYEAEGMDWPSADAMNQSVVKAAGDLLVNLGNGAVKALGGGKVGGVLVRYGSPNDTDLENDFFTKDTYFGAHRGDGVDVLFHHGIPVHPALIKLAGAILPPVKVSETDLGLWGEVVLDLADQYQAAIYALAQQGLLGWSTGAAGHLVKRTPMPNGANHVDQWIIAEASLTPTPAEYRNVVQPIKSLALPVANIKPDTGKEQIVSENIVVDAATNLNEAAPVVDVDAIKSALRDEILAELRAEPAVKSVGAAPAIHIKKGEADEVKAFDAFLRDGSRLPGLKAVKAALNETTAGQGGVLVPSQVAPEVIQPLSQGSLFRRAGAKVTTVTGTDSLYLPAVVGTSEAVIVAEGSNYDEKEPTLSTLKFVPWKFTRISLATEEVLEDSRVDVYRDVLAPDVTEAFVKAENKQFAIGDGTTGPGGIFGTSEATVGVTAASATTITTDEIVDLWMSLPEQYQQNATWMMNATTAAILRKAKASTAGTYLWGDLKDGTQTLMGRPVIINPYAPSPAINKLTVAVGDFSFYRIVQFGQMYVQRIDQLYALSGKVGFRFYLRQDGHLLQSAAISVLKQAAA